MLRISVRYILLLSLPLRVSMKISLLLNAVSSFLVVLEGLLWGPKGTAMGTKMAQTYATHMRYGHGISRKEAIQVI